MALDRLIAIGRSFDRMLSPRQSAWMQVSSLYMDKAETTFGMKGFAGLKLLPFYASGSSMAPSLILEANAVHLIDDDHEYGYFGTLKRREWKGRPVGPPWIVLL